MDNFYRLFNRLIGLDISESATDAAGAAYLLVSRHPADNYLFVEMSDERLRENHWVQLALRDARASRDFVALEEELS